jgi:hypothetical protein
MNETKSIRLHNLLSTSFSDQNRKSEIGNEKKFPVSVTGQSYRTINFWESCGLIENKREENSEWRKFTFVDIAWIMIISELKNFGYPINKLVKVKETLWQSISGEDSLLIQYLFSFRTKNYKLIMLSNDGSIMVDFPSKINLMPRKSCICINIYDHLLEFMENHYMKYGLIYYPQKNVKRK